MSRTPLRLTTVLAATALAAATAVVPASAATAPAPTSSARATSTAAVPAPVRAAGLSGRELRRATDAYRLLDGVFNQHRVRATATRYIDAKTYIQHNPLAANGRAAFIAFAEPFIAQNPQASLRIERVIAQGDLVVLHSLSRTNAQDRGSVVVDIFRFDRADKVVEHWDVVQSVSATTVSGNPQI